jgi:hypothetical protein
MAQIDAAFIKQFEAEVHVAYQQMASKLRDTVRRKTGVIGQSTTFQKVGKGAASSKTRHGEVPPMNLDHTPVECALADWYAGDWCDKLDELKTNIDEKRVIVNAGAYGLGRKIDDMIISKISANATTWGDSSTVMSKANAIKIIKHFNAADIPDDGDRYVIVDENTWAQLTAIDQFVNDAYVGDHPLVARNGAGARWWNSAWWIMHTGLSAGTGTKKCVGYHKTAVGLAEGLDITSDVTWHGDRASWFVNNMLSAGAVCIDTNGCFVFEFDADAAIT